MATKKRRTEIKQKYAATKKRAAKKLTAKRQAEIEQKYLFDSPKLGMLPVVAFGHEALREAFRVWWAPYQMGMDFDNLCGYAVWKPTKPKHGLHGFKQVKPARVVGGSALMIDKLDPVQKKLYGRHRKGMISTRCPVKVRLKIDYPVNETQYKVVTIDRRYPGEIFALLHDFYREVYAEDEKRGGKAGPMNDKCMNRGSGPLVWGHDIGDLVIEAVQYKAFTGKELKEGVEGEFSFLIGS